MRQDTPSHSRDAKRPSCTANIRHLKQRAQGMPGARSARSLACRKKTRELVTTVTPVHPAFPAQWFYGFLRALPGDRAWLPPSPADYSANLTPASGRQDHTTSPSAFALFVTSVKASTASRLTSVTIAKRPSERRDGQGYATDLGRARNGKFFDGGLDHPNHLDPLQQNSVLRKSPAGRAFPGESLMD
jgi:hypothetical protein